MSQQQKQKQLQSTRDTNELINTIFSYPRIEVVYSVHKYKTYTLFLGMELHSSELQRVKGLGMFHGQVFHNKKCKFSSYLSPLAPISGSMKLFHLLKSNEEPESGNWNPLTKKVGVPYTPLEALYCMTKYIHMLK